MQNNLTNSGKWLEKQLKEWHQAYEELGRAKVQKVDPPVQMLGKKVVLKRNPYLDFTGAWTEAGGQSLALEAKSTTDKPVLRILDEGGITKAQYEALIEWHNAGAAVGVLWGRVEIDEVRLVSIQELNERLEAGILHIKWEAVAELPHGPQPIRWDYLAGLRRIYPWVAQSN